MQGVHESGKAVAALAQEEQLARLGAYKRRLPRHRESQLGGCTPLAVRVPVFETLLLGFSFVAQNR